ncbi:MAG: hypothetical protein FWC65_03610 [Treponema sp.]|nr:hypothetical protein [Treponema sp.]
MCPDRQIISLYCDGELPSPWNEKMASHLEICPKCQAVLSGYRSLGGNSEELPSETIAAAQDRIWKKITAPELVVVGGSAQKPAEKTISRRLRSVGRIWNRRLILPLPAAAAAVLAIVIGFFALDGVRDMVQPQPAHPAAAAMSIGFDDYDMIPIHDMSDVIRYLSIQDTADFMIIRLPEHRNFSPIGQPTLINAADYSMARRNFHR